MFDVEAVLRDLALKRPIFHSEADFQHAVAWEVHSMAGAFSEVGIQTPAFG